MIQSDLQNLPTSAELPCSDDTPADNEDQNFIPNFLLFLLQSLWANRVDWFFGVDMGIYHTTGISPRVPVVPDGFLSLGVDLKKQGKSRKSYVVWEENNVVPIVALEIVSWTPGGEYEEKVKIYADLGVLYYVIYNPDYWLRDGHQPFEVYKLVNSSYQLQIGEPYWMPEIGLGIGRFVRSFGQIEQEVLYWYDQTGDHHLATDEQADLERRENERLRERLRSMGIDPDER